MIDMKNKKSKYILSLLFLIIGVGGTIIFFPAKMDEEYTCICDRMLSKPSGITPESFTLLVERFFFPFAFMWWGSILMAVLSGIYLVKAAARSGNTESRVPDSKNADEKEG